MGLNAVELFNLNTGGAAGVDARFAADPRFPGDGAYNPVTEATQYFRDSNFGRQIPNLGYAGEGLSQHQQTAENDFSDNTELTEALNLLFIFLYQNLDNTYQAIWSTDVLDNLYTSDLEPTNNHEKTQESYASYQFNTAFINDLSALTRVLPGVVEIAIAGPVSFQVGVPGESTVEGYVLVDTNANLRNLEQKISLLINNYRFQNRLRMISLENLIEPNQFAEVWFKMMCGFQLLNTQDWRDRFMNYFLNQPAKFKKQVINAITLHASDLLRTLDDNLVAYKKNKHWQPPKQS